MNAQARKEEIVSTALELAARQGVEQTTTQDMARAIGVTQGAIFRHFASKDDIWLAVMHWVQAQVGQVVERAAADGRDPLDSLQRVFRAHIAFIARHPGVPRVLFSELRHSRNSRLKQLLQQVMSGYENRIARIIEQGRLAGLVSPETDARAAATLFLGMFQGLVLQSSTFGEQRDLEAQAARVFPMFLKGIKTSDSLQSGPGEGK